MTNGTNSGLYGWDEMELTLRDVEAGLISAANGRNRLVDRLLNALHNDPTNRYASAKDIARKIRPTLNAYNDRKQMFSQF